MPHCSILLALALIGLATPAAEAHFVEQMFIELSVDGERWTAEVLFDAAYALPEMRADELSPAPPRSWLVDLPDREHARIRDGAQQLLRDYLRFDWSGEPLDWSVSFIDFDSSPPDFPRLRLDLAVTRVHAQGTLGAAPGQLNLSISNSCPLTFVVSIVGAGTQARFLTIAPGTTGRCWEVASDGSNESTGLGPIWIGYTHVLPSGMDHVLSMLGIFLLSRSWRSLIAQSLTFTLAHSVTLGLVFFGIVKVRGPAVEILIALSIAAIAIENLWAKSPSRCRYVTIFGFGLVHGLGFASALQVSLTGHGVQNLILANLGIELAQVTVIGAAWILTTPIYSHRHYDTARRVASLAIAAIGLWWAMNLAF